MRSGDVGFCGSCIVDVLLAVLSGKTRCSIILFYIGYIVVACSLENASAADSCLSNSALCLLCSYNIRMVDFHKNAVSILNNEEV